MTTQLDYDAEDNLMLQSLHGLCSISNLAEVFDKMDEFPVRPGLKILTDICDADLKEANYDSVSFLEKKLDEFLDKYLPVKKAIVAESDLEFGIARMYGLMSEKDGFEVNVFRKKSEALEWLKENSN